MAKRVPLNATLFSSVTEVVGPIPCVSVLPPSNASTLDRRRGKISILDACKRFCLIDPGDLSAPDGGDVFQVKRANAEIGFSVDSHVADLARLEQGNQEATQQYADRKKREDL